MKKFIGILKEQGVDESLLKLAPFALAKRRGDSYDHLKRLGRGEKNLMAAVLCGVIVLWLVKKFHKRCLRDLKTSDLQDSPRELDPYLEAIQLLSRLDASIDQQALRVKAVDFLLDRKKRRQALTCDVHESKLEHQRLLEQLIAALRTGTHRSENDSCRLLSRFLNSISFTTLGGRPFTRRNITK